MKRQYMLFVIVLLFCTNTSAQQKEYSGKIHVTALSLQQEGDSVYVKLSFDISGVNVDSRRSISLIPALVAAGDRLDLPEVVVKGRENYNVYRRETALMSNREKAAYAAEAPYAVVPGFKSGNAKTIAYSVAVKYNPWMADAKLDMYEDLCGCGNPARRIGITMLANRITLEKIIEPYEITPSMAYVQPVVEPVKRREIISEAFLDFVVNKTDIRPDYMNNPQELKKVTDLVAGIKDDPDVTVRAINVIGYASPEGLLSNNQRLSEGRAKAFSIEQAKEVFKSRPQNLSLNEMFLVANTYEKGSQEFIDLFETAVKLYPDDVTANLNAAAAALSRKDTVYAKRYLNKIEKSLDIPEYHNTMGVLEMLCGNYDKAASHLNKATEAGLPEAKQNLAEMTKKQENTILIRQQQSKKKQQR